jgi:invasion protein IalB
VLELSQGDHRFVREEPRRDQEEDEARHEHHGDPVNTLSGVKSALVLPLGLSLGAGVSPAVDDAALLAPLAFRTCLPAGCIVELAFDEAATVALRGGEEIKINLTADDGRALSLDVPLGGLGAALDRSTQITQ